MCSQPKQIDKATLAAKTAARQSNQVAEDAAAVVQTIQAVLNTVASLVTQLNKTLTTYRDAILKATTVVQQEPTSTTTLDARVCEGGCQTKAGAGGCCKCR